MTEDVRVVRRDDITKLFPNFDKRFKLREKYIVYVLFLDDTPVSCLSFVRETSNYAKIHACYTPVELRKKGFFKKLLSEVLKMHDDITIKADCLPASFGVFSECGFSFVEKQHCKGYTLYKTILKRR